MEKQPAWAALEQLAQVSPRFAHYTFRQACSLAPVPHSAAVVSWLRERSSQLAPVIDLDPRTTPSLVFDLSVGSLLLGADPHNVTTPVLDELLNRELRAASVELGIGRYDEARLLYSSLAFGSGSHPTDERRTILELMAKGSYFGVNLATADLDGTFEKLEASGAEVVQEPTVQPYGVRDCAFRDPAGNMIRIQELP